MIAVKDISVKIWGFLLIGIGLTIGGYKVAFLGLPISPNQQTKTWTVQAKVNFKGNGGPAIVDFTVPKITPGFSVLDEDFISSKYGLALQEQRESRVAQWAVRRARGEQLLYYRLLSPLLPNRSPGRKNRIFPFHRILKSPTPRRYARLSMTYARNRLT